MNITTYKRQEEERLGFLVEDKIVDVAGGAHALDRSVDDHADMLSLIESGEAGWRPLEELFELLVVGGLEEAGRGKWWWPKEEVALAKILRPRKNVWVVGANYLQHLANGYARLGRPPVAPAHVEFFTKALTSIVPHNADITYDKSVTRTVDYEVELTIVIGKEGRDIPASEALDYVFGYTVGNDVSARELQIGHRQYFRGKSLDGFCPLGPSIATTKAIRDPHSLWIRQWVNGDLKQDWTTGDMLFRVEEIVSVLSQGMTIEPGDMILTGTVPGVGFEQMPQLWLQHGDVVEAGIEGIGVVGNRILMSGLGSPANGEIAGE